LRPIRRIVDEALAALSPEFEQLYAKEPLQKPAAVIVV